MCYWCHVCPIARVLTKFQHFRLFSWCISKSFYIRNQKKILLAISWILTFLSRTVRGFVQTAYLQLNKHSRFPNREWFSCLQDKGRFCHCKTLPFHAVVQVSTTYVYCGVMNFTPAFSPETNPAVILVWVSDKKDFWKLQVWFLQWGGDSLQYTARNWILQEKDLVQHSLNILQSYHWKTFDLTNFPLVVSAGKSLQKRDLIWLQQ